MLVCIEAEPHYAYHYNIKIYSLLVSKRNLTKNRLNISRMKRSITTAKPNRNGIIKIWEKKDVGILLSLQDISYRSANMIVNSAQFRPGPQLSTPRPNRGRIHGHSSTSPSEYPGSLLLQASREQAGHAKDRAGK